MAVNFLPTSPQTSIGASLQGAIASTQLGVTTFAPGGGTILIQGAQLLRTTTGGSAPVDTGVLVPAITDLAGNRVRETRLNGETRFTVIMPEVVFDLGDAPSSYSTTFAENGPRHTVDASQLPRLGVLIDTEDDGQPINQDDVPLDVVVSQTPVTLSLFSIDSVSIPDTDQVTLTRLPVGAETLTINVAGVPTTFELVGAASNPVVGNIAVTFTSTDTIEDIKNNLVGAIRLALPQNGNGILVQSDTASSLVIRSIDDEDGVPTGIFTDGATNYNVFTVPGTDPNNIQATDVLGFLNPLDPAGTNIGVNVVGSGLLHAWIDFDQSGVFDTDEQVLANLPVNGDPVNGTFNFVTVLTPGDALDGSTWMRFRISESGTLLPTGVAVGGEVEDYIVEVISIALPMPEDDSYQIDEDTTLDTAADNGGCQHHPFPWSQRRPVRRLFARTVHRGRVAELWNVGQLGLEHG